MVLFPSLPSPYLLVFGTFHVTPAVCNLTVQSQLDFMSCFHPQGHKSN